MKIVIEPEARDFIVEKGNGEFILDMVTARGWCSGIEEPMVLLGKPKSRSFQFVPVDIDGITMYKNKVFGDDVRFQVSLAKLAFFKSLRIDPITAKE